jgi:single-strand selective monofunctional uracil DNA glycosylase
VTANPAKLLEIAERLGRDADRLAFAPPVTHVYNPLRYARRPHRLYLERFGARRGRVVLVGMNPGPWGMAQTGVPFGEVERVRDWMEIEAKVERPAGEHPKRPIEGFACRRSEVSGRRLWGWAADRFGSAERFFDRFFALNYCPLVFMEASGRNRTPDKLPALERAALQALCDEALRDTVAELEPRRVIGVGRFAEQRAAEALRGLGVPVGRILHPSPASPAANRAWVETIERELAAQDVSLSDLPG